MARDATWRMPSAGDRGLIPEGRRLFHEMSVDENLLLGAYPGAQRDPAHRPAGRSVRLRVMFPQLSARRKQPAGLLSGGEAQMLALARGLIAAPRILLIDEPSLGLAPRVVGEIFALLAQFLKDGGPHDRAGRAEHAARCRRSPTTCT